MTITRRDYTKRDFEGLKTKLQEYVTSRFPNAANDFYEDNVMMVLLELAAYVGDQQAFFLDMAFNECLWDTVAHRTNIIALAKLLGYQPRGISSALVTLDATTDAYVGTLSIAKGTIISTAFAGVVFEITENYAINGATAFTLNAIEGVTRVDTFFSNGTTNQLYTSTFSQVSPTVTPVVVVDGVEWEQVSFLWERTAGNFYQLQYTDDQKAQILFGDGVHGNVPPDTVEINLTYLTSKGAEGNLSAGKINVDIVGMVGGLPHNVRVINPEAAAGGAPEESVEEIRKNAPIYFQSLGNLTTARDLQGFVEAFPGVAKVQVVDDPSTKIVLVYIVASGYTAPTGALLTSIEDAVTPVLVMGAILGLRSVSFPLIDISGRIYLKVNYSVAEVTDSVNSALTEYFTPVDPASAVRTVGTDVHFSDVVRLLDEVEGVDYVELDQLSRKPVANLIMWATDSGTFDLLSVGVESREETWTVTFLTSTTFEVRGSVSGLQTATGTVGIAYATDGGRLSFIILAGTNPNQSGDYAEIRVSQYVGSVVIDDGEFTKEGTVNFSYHYSS